MVLVAEFHGRCLSRSQTPGHLEAFRTMWGFSKLWDAWTVFREPCLFWVHTQAGQMFLFWMKRPGISARRQQHNAMKQKAKYRNITCEKTATHQNSKGFRRIAQFCGQLFSQPHRSIFTSVRFVLLGEQTSSRPSSSSYQRAAAIYASLPKTPGQELKQKGCYSFKNQLVTRVIES